MELSDFFIQFKAEIQAEAIERMDDPEAGFPFEESIFTEKIMLSMAEWGMTDDQVAVCHYDRPIGNSRMKMNGYGIPDNFDRLDLFISLYGGEDGLEKISNQETMGAAEQCMRLLKRCATGKLEREIDGAHEDVMDFAKLVSDNYQKLTEIRIFVLTDRIAASRQFKPQEIKGKTVYLEVMDIERYFRLSGNPIDDIIINLEQTIGHNLPCLYIPKEGEDYACALTIIPAVLLRDLYERFGSRLLEGNVRSFLTAKGKVNKGIETTLLEKPNRFMAYNNGLVLVADDISIEKNLENGFCISSIKGLQIVNGGQTTASIYFAKKKKPEIDLSSVRIPAKIIILDKRNGESEEELISEISFYTNSQNVVKNSDLSANNKFHRNLEQIFSRLYCPDGESQWFYERATGSYAVKLAREASTKSQLKKLQERIPSARKITKTDLAKYIHAWEGKPVEVAQGAQKNFAKFMEMTIKNYNDNGIVPDSEWVKTVIAKTIVYKAADKIVSKLHTASKISVTTYLVSIFSLKHGSKINFGKIWTMQGISSQLQNLLEKWAAIVNDIIVAGSGSRLMSEWAKNRECWEQVKGGNYPEPDESIPEMHGSGIM